MKKLLLVCALLTTITAGIAGCATETAGNTPNPSHETETSPKQIPETTLSETALSETAPPETALPETAPPDPAVPGSQEESAKADPVKAPVNVTVPALVVTYGPDREELPSSSGGYQLHNIADDGTVEAVVACGAEPLSYLAETVSPLPYVKLGTGMYLEFSQGTPPDAITVQDMILNEDGSSKYNHQSTIEFPLTCTGAAASFSLDANPAAMLSSDMSAYEKGGIIRGFRVNCTWMNGSTAEYGFVLRTDASD